MTTDLPLIVFYDIDQLDRLSYYLSGFQLNQLKQRCRFKSVQRYPRFFNSPGFDVAWRDYPAAYGIFKYRYNEDEFYFCIDRSDHSSNKMNEGYPIHLLKRVRYYFKANFNAAAVQKDDDLAPHAHKIIPVLPSFPIRVARRLPFLPRTTDLKKIRTRMRQLIKLPTIDDYRRWRFSERDMDVFFLLIYYNKEHHRHLNQFRTEIMRALEKHKHLNVTAGFVSNEPLPSEVADLQQPRLSMKDYLEKLSRSKVAIYVRGPHDGISSKFGQYIAMGKPVVGQSLANNRDRLYRLQDFDRQFGYDDPNQIAERVVELLDSPDEMNHLALSNANIYDRYLHPENVVAELLRFIESKTETHTQRSAIRIETQLMRQQSSLKISQ